MAPSENEVAKRMLGDYIHMFSDVGSRHLGLSRWVPESVDAFPYQ